MAKKKGMKGVDLAIGILVVIIVAAATLPSAFDDWFNASTDNWPGMMESIWELVPFFGLLAILFYFYQRVD